jgi:transcriptional regulator with XRE-family HTH domain
VTALFGQLIKEQRIEMGLTQQRLADLVGRSPSTVRSWERDRATPNDETVIDSLSAILGLDKAILFGLAGVGFEDSSPEPEDGSEITAAGGSASTDDLVGDGLNQPDEAREESPPVQMGPEPAPRSNGDEARVPGAARAPEPAKPYLLQTDRRADHVRPGPLRPGLDDAGELPLFSDEAPDPVEPPFDWEAETDLDELPDTGPLEDLRAVEPVAPAGSNLRIPEAALEGAGSETEVEVDGDGWEGEPTQILMPAAPAEERLLGVATAKAVEYLAEPRPRPEPEPDAAEATQVIERTPLIEPAPTVEAVPQVTEPVRTVSRARVGAQPRTQTMESGRPIGANSYLDDPKEMRGYRIRAGLTTAALIALFILARWAWAGFREQIGGILDTLTTGF